MIPLLSDHNDLVDGQNTLISILIIVLIIAVIVWIVRRV